MKQQRTILVIIACLTTVVVSYLFLYFQTPDKIKANPQLIRLAILPDLDQETLKQRYSPLVKYLSQETRHEFELIIPLNYEDLENKFYQGEIEIAYFGGLTFVRNHLKSGAMPLVMRAVDTRFTSLFFTPGTSKNYNLLALKDKVIAFGARLSTSGHLMPRYFLKTEKQISADSYFSKVIYSGAHDKTAYITRDGIADIGVANTLIINSMLEDGRLKAIDLNIIWESPPYADYVWAIQRTINADLKLKLRDAFLNLDIDKKEHQEILNNLGAHHFLPADLEQYNELREIAEDMRLFK